MTASEEAKKAGLESLNEVSEATNTSRQTLNNWFKKKKKLFKVVILGCKHMKKPTRGSRAKANKKNRNKKKKNG